MTLKVFITAGEVSGDLLGARLMHALKNSYDGSIVFHGVGGALMEEEGLVSLFPMNDLSVMGIAEVLPKLHVILKRIKQTANSVTDIKPDIFISIDAPDFSSRVARLVRRNSDGDNIPKMYHYVAPSVWAWRPERAQKLAALYDGVLCLLPFEPKYFIDAGMKAAFIGHSMLEGNLQSGNGLAFREEYNIEADKFVVGILCGSRRGELKRVGPQLVGAARLLKEKYPEVSFLTLTLPHLKDSVQRLFSDQNVDVTICTNNKLKSDSFAAMNVAMAASGTVGLELAVANVPHVIAYKVSRITEFLVKNKLKTKFFHLVNILLDKEVVPELIQVKCNAYDICNSIDELVSLEVSRYKQLDEFDRARQMIGGALIQTPSQQAAEFILNDLR
jgi:lipid-A-disaccharide synthase